MDRPEEGERLVGDRAWVLVPRCQTAVIEVNPVGCWELDLKEDRAKLLQMVQKAPTLSASLAWQVKVN